MSQNLASPTHSASPRPLFHAGMRSASPKRRELGRSGGLTGGSSLPPPTAARAAACTSLLPSCLQLTYKEGPLAGQAAIRGAYINTASKDVGIDHDYQKAGPICCC